MKHLTNIIIWNLSYNERRMAIELELTKYLEEEEVDILFLVHGAKYGIFRLICKG